jgi:hypothetical protein
VKKTLLALTIALGFVLPANVESCGFFGPLMSFVLTTDPIQDVDAIAAGHLGIVQRTWRRRYLVVSYRYLAGVPLSTTERDALGRHAAVPFDAKPTASQKWLDARGAIAGIAPVNEIRQERPILNVYSSYVNCGNDAFASATNRLQELVKQYGRDSSELADWIAAQDIVFSNCSEGAHIPEATTGPLAADREYQIAASCFYAERLDEAREKFQQIARDPQSPWHEIAPYLATRALIRKATLPEKNDTELLKQADDELSKLSHDLPRDSLRQAAAALSHFTGARVRRPELLQELSASLMDPKLEKQFAQNLDDFLFTMDHLDPEEKPLGEMAEWISTMQSGGAEDADETYARWKGTNSLPWLVAAMTFVSPKDPRASELLEAAKAVGVDSPAYPTLTWLQLPIEREAQDEAAERDHLDQLLPAVRKGWPLSSVNQVLGERMRLARSLDEMLRFAPRTPIWEFDTADQRDKRQYLDSDSSSALDRGVPVRTLIEAARSHRLPSHLRRQIATAAFTRALVLEDDAAAKNLLPDVRRYYPALSPLLDGYAQADSAEARRFSAAYLLLKNPGLQLAVPEGKDLRTDTPLTEISSGRQNWWQLLGPNTKTAGPRFLAPAAQEQFHREWAVLSKLPAPATKLGQTAIAWAKLHPEDPRNPEALHRTVRATRFTFGDSDNGRISKAAFDLLHKRWPNSEWARRTPYWFQ